MGNRHDWNSWDHYKAIHEKRLRDLSHFVLQDALSFEETETLIFGHGVLYCSDGLEIHVTKQLEVQLQQGWPLVRTVQYSYHVLRRVGTEVINLFRYC